MSRTEPTWIFAVFVALSASAFIVPAQAQFEARSHFIVAGPQAAAVGDFNHDGNLDVAYAANQMEVFFGNGDGTFRPGGTYSTVLGSDGIVAADFNHDGKLDLALATYLDDSVTVMLGNGDGTFSQGPVLKATASPYFVAVGDFNHNGRIDIVAVETGPGCNCIAVFPGNGDGTFQPVIETQVTDATPLELAVGDFNHDGKTDVAVTEIFGSINQVSIWLGNGDGTFDEGESYELGTSPFSVVAADFNGDGHLDLAVTDFEGGNIAVLIGEGNGTFNSPAYYPVPFPGDLHVSDFNQDNKLDLAVACGSPPISGACVLLGDGNGAFGASAFYPVAPVSGALAIGDFNGDGKTDLITGDGSFGYLVTLLNTGTVSYNPTTPTAFGKQESGTTSPARKVTLTNTGKTELNISAMKVAGQFAMTSTCSKVIVPNKSCTISVTFSPKSQGAKSGTITINDSASSKPQVIELSGTGT